MSRRGHQERMRRYMERKASPDWTPSPLQVARKRAGLSRKELADRAHISERTVDRLEQRQAFDVKLGTVYRLAWVLGCERLAEIVDPDWLEWKWEGEPEGPPPELD
jgi:transcriptional regulator with XRE-family HTH domain